MYGVRGNKFRDCTKGLAIKKKNILMRNWRQIRDEAERKIFSGVVRMLTEDGDFGVI